MTRFARLMLAGLFALAAAGQAGAQVPPSAEVKLRREIYQDADLTAYLLEIPPGQATQMHRHDTDILTVFITSVATTTVIEGAAPVVETPPVGSVRYRPAGFTHSSSNNDRTVTFRSVVVEFKRSRGAREAGPATAPTLFCTPTFCAEDRTLAAGEATGAYADATLIAVTDAGGARTAGTVWRVKGAWTNTGQAPVRLVAIVPRG